MLQRMEKGEEYPILEELFLFYKDDELTMEVLEQMLQDLFCNTVAIPPPDSINSPPGEGNAANHSERNTFVMTYQRHSTGNNRGRGRGRGCGRRRNPTLTKSSYFEGRNRVPF